MDEIDIFETVLKNYTLPPIEYMVVFNNETGEILKVGPSYAFTEDKYKISIDNELATRLIEGQIRMSSCAVNVRSGKLEIAEVKSVRTIDDILHRIIDRRWTDMTDPDVFLTYDTTTNKLTVELSKYYGGNRLLPDQEEPTVARKIIWDGDTVMKFLITGYNDPNVLYEMISIKCLGQSVSTVLKVVIMRIKQQPI